MLQIGKNCQKISEEKSSKLSKMQIGKKPTLWKIPEDLQKIHLESKKTHNNTKNTHKISTKMSIKNTEKYRKY